MARRVVDGGCRWRMQDGKRWEVKMVDGRWSKPRLCPGLGFFVRVRAVDRRCDSDGHTVDRTQTGSGYRTQDTGHRHRHALCRACRACRAVLCLRF